MQHSCMFRLVLVKLPSWLLLLCTSEFSLMTILGLWFDVGLEEAYLLNNMKYF